MKDLSSLNASAAFSVSQDRQILSSPGESRPSDQVLGGEALLLPLISVGHSGLKGHHVLRSPGALRLHPAFNDLNLSGWLINSELLGKPQDVREPILITRAGIILGGFAEWHAGVCAGQPEIDCIQLPLMMMKRSS
jgi:hypothetical protein